MKNIYTFIFGLIGFWLFVGLALEAEFATRINPVFVLGVSAFGLLMAGELMLIGIGKKS